MRITKTLTDYHVTSQEKLWKASTNSVMNHSSQIPIATAGEFNMMEGASKCLAFHYRYYWHRITEIQR